MAMSKEALPELSDLIEANLNKDSEVKTFNVVLTPETASQFLDGFNTENRPLSKTLASTYANEFLRGKWNENGENIIYGVNEDGDVQLISGQHRLVGLCMAQVQYDADPKYWKDAVLVMKTQVTTGVSMDFADDVDKGKTRSHSDVLYRSPIVDSMIPDQWNDSQARRTRWCKCLATAARLVWQREGGKTVSSAEKFVHSEMLEYVSDRHPELYSFVTLVMDAHDNDGGNRGLKISLAYLAGFSYLACLGADGKIIKDYVETIELFLDQVACGTGYEKGSAAHAITGYWNSLDPGSKNRDLDVSGPLVKCLNYLLEDATDVTSRKLKLTKKERTEYKSFPPLLQGWDEACFEAVALAKAEEVADQQRVDDEAREAELEAEAEAAAAADAAAEGDE
jgi:hypothetical protein